METLLSDDSRDDEHYHDTKEHGLVWVILNEMLHLIVLLFTLFGMIRFKVKFIHMVKLVNLISLFMIIHSWYMTIKFGLIATVMYFFNQELESIELPWSALNCSLENVVGILSDGGGGSGSSSSRSKEMRNFTTNGELDMAAAGLGERQQHPAGPTFSNHQRRFYTLALAQLLQTVGGPYRMLGNRTTLMYGFYAVAILMMLAIFPIELMYLDIGFNYIRFVLNDTGCLRDFYGKRQKHLDRLNNWTRNNRNQSGQSNLTLSMKKIASQRDLRSAYLLDRCKGPAEQMILNHLLGSVRRTANIAQPDATPNGPKYYPQTNPRDQGLIRRPVAAASAARMANDAPPPIHYGSPLDGLNEEKFRAPVKSLRHSLSTNHLDQPSYSVRVANKNLRKFKPLVRSQNWFMTSMVMYPIFILFYFVFLTIFIGLMANYLNESLEATNRLCHDEVDPKLDLYSDWTLLDRLTFFETHFVVFSLSCASSFYCSYYFCTILELHVWIQEISQQLNLCKLVLDYTSLNHFPITSNLQTIRVPSLNYKSPILPTNYTSKILQNPDSSPLIEALVAYHNIDSHYVDRCFNQFGGLKCLCGHIKFNMAPQSERLKRREYMACKLVFKKQTVLRATYINLNLFFDELNDTKFMIKTILKRTTQIAFGFALLVGITRTQFKSNSIYMRGLLAASLAILNLYLICAASINSAVNKLLPQIHGVICASITAGTDQDLLEFWLRHIQAYGTDRDAMSYKIYGYKITWSSILNFNGAVSSAYLFTVY